MVLAEQQASRSNAVRIENLTKSFGSRIAVDSVNLEVAQGIAFGLLGPNGAGKTTLIRMLVGLLRPTHGRAEVLGSDVGTNLKDALSQVGAIVEEPKFHPHLTGRENLELVASLRSQDAWNQIDASLIRVGLGGRENERVGRYSLGMRQRLGIARCLLTDPKLLILDEPMNGLDPPGIAEVRGLIRELVDEGRTVIISSHLLDEIEKTCDEVAIMSLGKVVSSGTLEWILGSGGRAITLRTSDDVRSLELLTAVSEFAAVTRNGQGIKAEFAVQTDLDNSDQIAAKVARSLIEAGVDIYQLGVDSATLEDRFFEMTGTTDVTVSQ